MRSGPMTQWGQRSIRKRRKWVEPSEAGARVQSDMEGRGTNHDTPLPFTLSQATLPCPQASPMLNGDTIEAKQLKDLQDLQEKEPLKKYRLTESMKNISGSV